MEIETNLSYPWLTFITVSNDLGLILLPKLLCYQFASRRSKNCSTRKHFRSRRDLKE